MTKEELEREYYGRRPTEPYSEDDSPNDWGEYCSICRRKSWQGV